MPDIVAETDRLVLRTIEPGDAARQFELLNTPAVMERLGGPKELHEIEAKHAKSMALYAREGFSFLFMIEKASGEVVGHCGMKRVDNPLAKNIGDHEVGWLVREDRWRRGYAEEAMRAVLDWELSTLGHPLADFTYFLMVWHFPPTIRGGLAGLDLAPLGIPSLDEAVARYCEKTGRKTLADFDFCLAYNMFRLASIAQGVYARALQGNASSPEGMKMGESVAPLATMAWEYAKKAGA